MKNRFRWIVLALLVAAGTGLFAFSVRTPDSVDLPPSETLRLEVDLSERSLTALGRDGEVVRTYPVTIGAANHPTPTGQFRIDWLIWNPSWNPPDSDWARGKKAVGPGPNNPMGRVKLFFKHPTYYVHGTNDAKAIGEAASHGCVRMLNGDVIELAQLVMENGGEARPANWFRRLIDRFRDTERVTLSRPVVVTIRD